ncbi:hypothetical protein LOTGIDRAFT_231199 [Lottia gigantea]|uniref:Uncharacterized protein n=1 Tax=Lottia gigantea TaxID=225164 RepID=V4A4M5_LOTGI|nr:hypothetical protein LOTGIDRAFT_231199 [Lottia gigantea]ESO98833.1 hypothetical protein LOTGIDRAFT_231199 [Lottia gigantea]
MCPGIKHILKTCSEELKLVVKFIFEPITPERDGEVQVLLEPLLTAIRTERYVYVKDIYIWNYPMSYENVASLCLLIGKPVYLIRQIEMMDCLLETYSIKRFSSVLSSCAYLTIMNLDYNEFGDEGCLYLCNGLIGNKTITSVSMCYCDLGVESGKYLGNIVSTTTVQELYLDGNNLECEGTVELIKVCVDQAEFEAFQKAEAAKLKADEEARIAQEEKENKYNKLGTSDEEYTSGVNKEKKIKKKGKKKKKKKEPPPPPPVGPWIKKLHLADNGIDYMGEGKQLAPLICMRLFKKLLMFSEGIEELDLDDNLISDMGGRELLDGLTFRKEEKLKGVKVRTTHRMTSETFNAIVKLGSGLKKKKKKGKKKKKK